MEIKYILCGWSNETTWVDVNWCTVPRASQVKYYCILKSFYRIITGTATTLVMGHEPMSYEALKFCGSFLQFYYVNMKEPK